MQFLLVFTGGGVGCVLRYLIGLYFLKLTSLPIATFVSNVTACLIFTLAMWFIKSWPAGTGTIKLLLLTGFCGGLSTFSTLGYETILLLRQGWYLFSFLNIVITTAVCLLVFYFFDTTA